VLGNRLSIEEMCMKLSTNPARIMGLAPRKGSIAIGADADLAIIHPTRTHKVDPKSMETNADWSPYNGWDLAGFSRTTLSRGEVIVDDYRVVGKEGRGVWLRREPGTGNREQCPSTGKMRILRFAQDDNYRGPPFELMADGRWLIA
jgi:dihydropyrimidinase